MCELLTISSQYPANMGFSLKRLASHSQNCENDIFSNPDGWGVAYYDDKDVSLLREPQSANDSELVRFIENHIPATQLLISHIRKATQGNRALKNTQPFTRELAGRMHVFAHNGNLPGIHKETEFSLNHFHPIGETDSEHAFCYLLDKLKPLWLDYKYTLRAPSIRRRFDVVSEFAERLRQFGPANFVYSDSDVCFAHADKRIQEDCEIKPPGLHILSRLCDMKKSDANKHTHGLNIHNTVKEQKILIVASVPLTTDEKWQAVTEGEVLVFSHGEIIKI